MPQKDSIDKTIGNRCPIWLEKSFQARNLDKVQLIMIKCTKCTTVLSGKGHAHCLQSVEDGQVSYSCNHCLRHNTARSVNPTNIKKRMCTEPVTDDTYNTKHIETGQSFQSQGKQKKAEVTVVVKKETITAQQKSNSGKGKEKETIIRDEEGSELEIASDYGMSELDDIDWQTLEMSVRPSINVTSTQNEAVQEAGERMKQAYTLSSKVLLIQTQIGDLEKAAWKLRCLARLHIVEVQKLLKKYQVNVSSGRIETIRPSNIYQVWSEMVGARTVLVPLPLHHLMAAQKSAKYTIVQLAAGLCQASFDCPLQSVPGLDGWRQCS